MNKGPVIGAVGLALGLAGIAVSLTNYKSTALFVLLMALAVALVVGSLAWALSPLLLRRAERTVRDWVREEYKASGGGSDVEQMARRLYALQSDVGHLNEQFGRHRAAAEKKRQEMANGIGAMEAEFKRRIAYAVLADVEAEAVGKGWEVTWSDDHATFIKDSSMATVRYGEIDLRKLRDALELDEPGKCEQEEDASLRVAIAELLDELAEIQGRVREDNHAYWAKYTLPKQRWQEHGRHIALADGGTHGVVAGAYREVDRLNHCLESTSRTYGPMGDFDERFSVENCDPQRCISAAVNATAALCRLGDTLS